MILSAPPSSKKLKDGELLEHPVLNHFQYKASKLFHASEIRRFPNELHCSRFSSSRSPRAYWVCDRIAADIADGYGRSEGHVKDVGYELLQMLSDILKEPISKGNLQSVLEKQGNLKFSLVDQSVNNNNIVDKANNIINCLNLGSDPPKTTSDKSPLESVTPLQNQEIARIKKLKKCGLSDEKIADVLDLSLEAMKNLETGELSE